MNWDFRRSFLSGLLFAIVFLRSLSLLLILFMIALGIWVHFLYPGSYYLIQITNPVKLYGPSGHLFGWVVECGNFSFAVAEGHRI